MLTVTTGAAVHVRRKDLMSEFDDEAFAYRLNPFFPCSSAAAATGNLFVRRESLAEISSLRAGV